MFVGAQNCMADAVLGGRMPPEPKRQDFKSQVDYEKALEEYIWADEEQGEKELEEFFKRKEAE
jgi:hypothetical protein